MKEVGVDENFQKSNQMATSNFAAMKLFNLSDNVLQTSSIIEIALSSPLNYAGSSFRAERRNREYRVGRILAANLLNKLGVDDTKVSMGKFREPVWPIGIVGSITHTASVIAVAVASEQKVRALGVDSEKLVGAKTADEISETCLTPQERFRCGEFREASEFTAQTLLFSTKESLFKCIFPLVGHYFDFLDAEIVEIDWRNGHIRTVLLKRLSKEFPEGSVFDGRFRLCRGHVHTSFELGL